MRWIVILGRIAGAATPFGSVLLQARAELNDAELQQRLRKLEDPISSLHPDVIEFSEKLYDAVSEINNWRVVPDEETLARYGRVLAILRIAGSNSRFTFQPKEVPSGPMARQPTLHHVHVCAFRRSGSDGAPFESSGFHSSENVVAGSRTGRGVRPTIASGPGGFSTL